MSLVPETTIHDDFTETLSVAAQGHKPFPQRFPHASSKGEEALKHVIWCDECIEKLRGLDNTEKFVRRSFQSLGDLDEKGKAQQLLTAITGALRDGGASIDDGCWLLLQGIFTKQFAQAEHLVNEAVDEDAKNLVRPVRDEWAGRLSALLAAETDTEQRDLLETWLPEVDSWQFL